MHFLCHYGGANLPVWCQNGGDVGSLLILAEQRADFLERRHLPELVVVVGNMTSPQRKEH